MRYNNCNTHIVFYNKAVIIAKRKCALICIICFYSFLNILNAQQQFHFTQLTQSFTNAILKDSDGFIWIGTQDGLLRYDNYSFKIFRYQSNDEFSLPNNYVKEIIEDKDQNLWIGTFGGGLVQWDRDLERFYSYSINTKAESIHSLELFQDSLLLIGSENGLIEFNIRLKTSTNLSATEDSEEVKFINDIYVTDEDDIILGTNDGALLYNIEQEKKHILSSAQDLIVSCIEGKAHRIYIGTNKGLFIYNKRKEEYVNHIADKNVTSILLLGNDEWFVGTNSGIGHFKSQHDYKWYESNSTLQNGLKSDLIHVLTNLEDDMIWAGTRKGVHQFSIRSSDFYSLGKQYDKFLCSTTALGMAEDKNKDVWICSREGLMQFETATDIVDWKAYCYTSENTKGMMNSYTINISEDSNQDLWLAYREKGFSRLQEKNGKWEWENFPLIVEKLGGDGVNQVFQDMSGRYWLASRGKGLIQFNPENQEMKFYNEKDGLSHGYVFRIYQSKQGILWLSTANGGLCQFNIEKAEFICQESDLKDPKSLSANMVLAINKHSDNRLLVCTTNGLNIKDENGFININTIDGLPNNVVYGALEDDNGKIWISTNEGISRLDLSQEVINVTNYNKSHGLASYEFNQHSFLEHSSGLFLFGGVEGVTVFDPLKIEDYKITPKIAFTDFQLFNKSVSIGSSSGKEFKLEKSINKIDKIRLNYNENSIAFEYAALGLTSPENTIYQYKLEGLEKEWVSAGKRNYAPYPKISHGDYTFKVRLTDLNKNVVSHEKSVKLTIATPPWERWWAYTLYFITLLGTIFLITRIQKARTLAIAKAREDERDVFRKKLARDFHDEAGNKITRISLITDNVTRKSKDMETVNTLHKLQDNIQDLRLGMTDFIWVLDPGKDTLGETLRRFMDFSNETFEYTEINFTMQPIHAELNEIAMESNIRRHFILIMKEATTNILKHSKATHVNFLYSNNADTWTFTLEDNGQGFKMDELERVNGINNMKSRADKVQGDLIVESEINKGSKISLVIKL